MKKCLLHAKKRVNAPWKPNTSSKRPVLLSLKNIETETSEAKGRRINAKRVDTEAIHRMRVMFNEQHFGCKEFYHQNGTKTWIAPMPEKKASTVTIKRIVQILVPSNFFYVTDKTRKRLVCKRDIRHKVVSSEEVEKNIVAHGENAAKEMLLKEGISADSIMTKRNVCYVTLHKQVTEEKIRSIFPTLNIRIFKMKQNADF